MAKTQQTKKASPKKAESSSKAHAKDAEVEKKSARARDAEEDVTEATAAPVDPDELEESEDAAAAAGNSGGAGGNAAAIAAAAGSGEMSASFKNFRHHPDMENFYRFIYENDLRHEALAILDEIQTERQSRKSASGGKSSGKSAH